MQIYLHLCITYVSWQTAGDILDDGLIRDLEQRELAKRRARRGNASEALMEQRLCNRRFRRGSVSMADMPATSPASTGYRYCCLVVPCVCIPVMLWMHVRRTVTKVNVYYVASLQEEASSACPAKRQPDILTEG